MALLSGDSERRWLFGDADIRVGGVSPRVRLACDGSGGQVSFSRLGLRMPNPATTLQNVGAFERMAALAQRAETSGFDSLWVSDQVGATPNPDGGPGPVFEAYSLLGALAARTELVGLGVLPAGPTLRLPSMVAKMITGIDVISHGRGILALGVAPTLDDETIGRLSEEIQVCRALLTLEAPSFAGQYYRLHEASNRPRPVRAGGIPLVVVADHPGVAEPVARWADAVMVRGDYAQVELMVDAIDERCETVQRSREDVAIIWTGEVDESPKVLLERLAAMNDLGVKGCVLSLADGFDLDATAAIGRAVAGYSWK